jgi:RecJ-like exonuclease
VSCPECDGTGRLPGVTPSGLVCDHCDGTGDYFRACVRRAYVRGRQDGIDAMRTASLPGPTIQPAWNDLIRPL